MTDHPRDADPVPAISIEDALLAAGINLPLKEGDLIEGICVIAKVNTAEGTLSLTGDATGFNWLELSGALDYAYQNAGTFVWRDDINGTDE
jgi:hypothetical protein